MWLLDTTNTLRVPTLDTRWQAFPLIRLIHTLMHTSIYHIYIYIYLHAQTMQVVVPSCNTALSYLASGSPRLLDLSFFH